MTEPSKTGKQKVRITIDGINPKTVARILEEKLEGAPYTIEVVDESEPDPTDEVLTLTLDAGATITIAQPLRDTTAAERAMIARR